MTVEELIEIICDALNKVDEAYFNLKTTYEPNGIVRERVFCYELYHQLRKLIGENSGLTLNGEIDKRGHIHFEEADRKNPDFVFHIPGFDYGNTIVCEVKGVISSKIEEDFKKVLKFVTKYNYQAGIFILYNHTAQELFDQLPIIRADFKNAVGSDRIHILTLPNQSSLEKPNLLSAI